MDTAPQREKRSQSQGTAQPEGVGARQTETHSPQQEGGYLEIYRFGELEKRDLPPQKIDPRLSSLRDMGLNPTFIKIAAVIGFDNFLKMWEILDADERLKKDSGGISIQLRAYRAYKRHLRNRHIVLLHRQSKKLGNTVIAKKVAESLGEKIDPSQIYRVIERGR